MIVEISYFFSCMGIGAIYGYVYRRQRKRIRELEMKLKEKSTTDDDLICTLEAWDTPLARRLLSLAQEKEQPKLVESPSPQPQLTVGQASDYAQPFRIVDDDLFEEMRQELNDIDFDENRCRRVHSWIDEMKPNRYRLSTHQRRKLVAIFDFDETRNEAHDALVEITDMRLRTE